MATFRSWPPECWGHWCEHTCLFKAALLGVSWSANASRNALIIGNILKMEVKNNNTWSQWRQYLRAILGSRDVIGPGEILPLSMAVLTASSHLNSHNSLQPLARLIDILDYHIVIDYCLQSKTIGWKINSTRWKSTQNTWILLILCKKSLKRTVQAVPQIYPAMISYEEILHMTEKPREQVSW